MSTFEEHKERMKDDQWAALVQHSQRQTETNVVVLVDAMFAATVLIEEKKLEEAGELAKEISQSVRMLDEKEKGLMVLVLAEQLALQIKARVLPDGPTAGMLDLFHAGERPFLGSMSGWALQQDKEECHPNDPDVLACTCPEHRRAV